MLTYKINDYIISFYYNEIKLDCKFTTEFIYEVNLKDIKNELINIINYSVFYLLNPNMNASIFNVPDILTEQDLITIDKLIERCSYGATK